MNLTSELSQAASAAIKALYGADVAPETLQISRTKDDFEGHLTLVVFPILRLSRKKPEQTAEEIAQWLVANTQLVARYNVIKGFLNLVISADVWQRVLDDCLGDADFGLRHASDDAPLVMVEYSSPNTNKPLHLGHVRNNLLGYALSRLLEASGLRVIKTNIVNDRGIHICKSMLAWQKWGNGATPTSTGKKGDHLIGDYYVAFDQHYRAEVRELSAQIRAAHPELSDEDVEKRAKEESPLMRECREMLVRWENGDKDVRALWRMMNEWVYEGFEQTYKALGVSFDKIYYESDTYLEGKAKVEEGLAKGLFYRREDGSVWADLTAEGLDEKLLLRADGTSVYMTQDIGTATLRFQDFPISKMVYVVGNEQEYHFQVLSLLLDRLGFAWGKDLVHFSYGMVELPNGKMKSREGTVVDADDLIALVIAQARAMIEEAGKFDDMDEAEKQEVSRIVGLGALKYFLLRVDARKNMLFNPEESIDFNGNTGPFVQYTYARIRSILRKAGEQRPSPTQGEASLDGVDLSREEALIQSASELPNVVQEAAKAFAPSMVAQFCYTLTKEFNSFYHDCPILREENESLRRLRLQICALVARVLRNGMGILGIELPERM